MAYEVVRKLSFGLENLGHCITMDNYFKSIPLLIDLASRGIYGTCTIRINHIGIPSLLKNTRQGCLLCRDGPCSVTTSRQNRHDDGTTLCRTLSLP